MLVFRLTTATGGTHYFLPLPFGSDLLKYGSDSEDLFLVGRSFPESLCIFLAASTTFPVPLQLSQAFVAIMFAFLKRWRL